jgi:hypothetical protein
VLVLFLEIAAIARCHSGDTAKRRLIVAVVGLAFVIRALRDVLSTFRRVIGPPPAVALVPRGWMVFDEAEGWLFVKILVAPGVVDRLVLVAVQYVLETAFCGIQEGYQALDLVGGFLPQPDERCQRVPVRGQMSRIVSRRQHLVFRKVLDGRRENWDGPPSLRSQYLIPQADTLPVRRCRRRVL